MSVKPKRRERPAARTCCKPSACWRRRKTRESVKVQEKAVELAAQSVRENKKRVEVGTLAPLDERQAEAQEAASRADLLQTQRVLAAAENALKRLLTDRFSEVQPVDLIPSDPLTAPSQ